MVDWSLIYKLALGDVTKDITGIGIENGEAFAWYKGNKISIKYDKDNDDWLECIKKFEKIAVEIGVGWPTIDYIIKKLSLKQAGSIKLVEPKKKKRIPFEDEDKPKEVTVYKYSGNGRYPLHESIIVNGYPMFVTYDKEKVFLKQDIEEHGRILCPPNKEECPFPVYEFENEAELNEYIRRVKGIKSVADLFYASKHFWKMYVDHDEEIINLLAADSILTYFQDLFSVIHYTEAVGKNDVGKSSMGYTMQYIGYRAVKATSISGANYFRMFGSVEPGQCVVIEDEGDSISDDPDKVRILKAGYEYNEKIPKTNINTQSQEQNWFFVYGYKMILAEKSLRQLKAKGLVDRTYTLKCRPGKVKYSIKDVVSEVINKSPKLDILYRELLDFRKILLCYRLIHYKDELARIKVNLENRDKELIYPLLQLFYGTEAFEDVRTTAEFFTNQRHQRKSRSLEAALYPIIKLLIFPNGEPDPFLDESDDQDESFTPDESQDERKNKDIPFSSIWNKIIGGSEIAGHYDDKRPNEYDTKEYGKLYGNTLSNLISDIFGADIRHTNKGSKLVFDLEKFHTFKDTYEVTEKIEEFKIIVELEGDGSGGSDGSGYALGDYCHNFNYKNKEKNEEKDMGENGPVPSLEPSLPSPPSPEIALDKNEETCGECGEKYLSQFYKRIHRCEPKPLLRDGQAIQLKELGIKNKIKVIDSGNYSKYSKSYNGIIINDVNESQSGSPYICHHYGCTECNFKSWVYDDVFRHLIIKHLEVCIEPEYLKNEDYVEALNILDQCTDRMRSFPMYSDFALRIARETFVKYNSMNQRYFKKLLPKGQPIKIQKSYVPKWKEFIEEIGGTDELSN